MKYAKLYIFLFLSFLCTAFAQTIETKPSAVSDTSMHANNNGDEVNIDSLVSAQIAIAQAKKWENYKVPEKQEPVVSVSPKVEIENKATWVSSLTSIIGLGEETTAKVEIILFAAMLVFIVVFSRRFFLKPQSNTKKLRSNIQLMRNEKSVTKKETKLKVIRENLLNSSVSLSASEGSLTRKAKELKIAKGEIILAAKIKSYELSVCSNER